MGQELQEGLLDLLERLNSLKNAQQLTLDGKVIVAKAGLKGPYEESLRRYFVPEEKGRGEIVIRRERKYDPFISSNFLVSVRDFRTVSNDGVSWKLKTEEPNPKYRGDNWREPYIQIPLCDCGEIRICL